MAGAESGRLAQAFPRAPDAQASGVALQGAEQLGSVIGGAGAEDGQGQVAVGGVAALLQGGVTRAAAMVGMRSLGSHLPRVSQLAYQSEGAKYSNG